MATKKRAKRTKVTVKRTKRTTVIRVTAPAGCAPARRGKRPKAASLHRAAVTLSNPDASAEAKHRAAVTLGRGHAGAAPMKRARKSRKKKAAGGQTSFDV